MMTSLFKMMFIMVAIIGLLSTKRIEKSEYNQPKVDTISVPKVPHHVDNIDSFTCKIDLIVKTVMQKNDIILNQQKIIKND